MDDGGEKLNKRGQVDASEFKKGQPLKPKVKLAYDFPVNTSFMLQGTVYRVRKAISEMNTDMRMVQSINGEEIFTVTTLRNDAVDDPDFIILE
jgi:hypothetical protein